MEELDTEISVGELIDTIEYDYPQFHLSMDCFWCEIVSGNLVLKEHEAARWLTKKQLNDVKWLPADVTSVSYTHLDVYKRQHKSCGLSGTYKVLTTMFGNAYMF